MSGFVNGSDWKTRLDRTLPLLGHRNWIVIADAAYPAQSSNAIRTVLCDSSQIDVLRYVLTAIAKSSHVEPEPFVDQELRFVPESDAPGITLYRQQLASLLPASVELRHEQLIAKMEEASRAFRILVLKTNMTIPYTSVFLQLDCAYWNQSAESRLQSAITEMYALSDHH